MGKFEKYCIHEIIEWKRLPEQLLLGSRTQNVVLVPLPKVNRE
jgi:hypothetical protein